MCGLDECESEGGRARPVTGVCDVVLQRVRRWGVGWLIMEGCSCGFICLQEEYVPGLGGVVWMYFCLFWRCACVGGR